MSRPVYSVKYFAGVAPTSGLYVGPEVAAGTILVVRDICLYQPSLLTAGGTGCLIYATSEGIPFYGSSTPFSQSNRWYHWEGRQVIETSDSVTVSCLDADWVWRISGYSLVTP